MIFSCLSVMANHRRLYETPENLREEGRVIERLCEKWRCAWKKLPVAYRVDFALTSFDSEVKAWLEIKCRSSKYAEMHISLHKVMAGLELSRVTGLPFFLAYAFGDEIYWRRITLDTHLKTIMWGRTDRDDWQDIEPTVVFALESFKAL